jgi:hypothetical protein
LRSLRYLATAFNDGPVTRDTRKARDLILSEWYQSLWPEVQLTRAGETSFANTSTGTREGVPFGSLTSQRGDRLIIVDPHSVETAESEIDRANTTRKFREGAINRLNDQARSAIVIIMQRLHEQDVAGTVLGLNMGYEHLMLPMEFEIERCCPTSIGFTDRRTTDGDLLDPVRLPREVVDALKRRHHELRICQPVSAATGAARRSHVQARLVRRRDCRSAAAELQMGSALGLGRQLPSRQRLSGPRRVERELSR